jgi:hypothetical protein
MPSLTNKALYVVVVFGILTPCLPGEKTTGGTFVGGFSLDLSPTEESPYLFPAQERFAVPPEFTAHQGPQKASIIGAGWIHHALSRDDSQPKNFQSRSQLSVAPDLLDFQTPLPILILDVDGLPTHASHEYQDCTWALIEPSTNPPFPGKFTQVGRGGLKRRGSSSRSQLKLPFRLELRDWRGKDQAASLLGMPSASDWILSPPSEQDPSILRNPLMFALSRDCGQYAPLTRFVEVFLNFSNKRLGKRDDYFGVYALTEKIEAGEGRVEVELPKQNAETPYGLSEGLVFKYDRPGPGEKGIQIKELDATFYLTSPKESKLRYRDGKILEEILSDFAVALRAPDGVSPSSGKSYRDYIDAPSWHTWRWLGELSKNRDLYKASSYFHLPLGGPQAGLIKAGPVWDFDRTINSYDPSDDDPIGWTAGETWLPDLKQREARWWFDLLRRPEFIKDHCLHWQMLRKGPLSWEKIEARLKVLEGRLSESSGPNSQTPFQRDGLRWQGTSPRGGTLRSEVEMMSEWLQARLQWIDQQTEIMLERLEKS